MDRTSREDLSALMDGELAAEPTRFLLRRLDHDPELGALWSRWHLIRACLAADTARLPADGLDSGFTARVAAAVAAEAAPLRTRSRHWTRYVGGGAIAASVAVAALMLNVPHNQSSASLPVAQARSVASATVATATADVAPAAANDLAPAWLLTRQPTVLSAQPASANVVYGTGLMQPDYLQRAGYSRDALVPYAPTFQPAQAVPPLSAVWVPEAPQNRATATAARH